MKIGDSKYVNPFENLKMFLCIMSLGDIKSVLTWRWAAVLEVSGKKHLAVENKMALTFDISTHEE